MNRLRTESLAADASGNERLRLVLVHIAHSETSEESEGMNFHSLVWERRIGGSWEVQLRITEEQFEADTDRGRWPSRLDSFDAAAGTAVLQVGQGNAPRGSGRNNYEYSWRQWDLKANSEKKYFYTCKIEEVFKPFDPKRSDLNGLE